MTRQRKWQLKQRERGLCTICGRPAKPKKSGGPSVYCADHEEKQKQIKRKNYKRKREVADA